MQTIISQYVNHFSLDFEEKMITRDYNGPSKTENRDITAFDLEIIKLIEVGIFNISILNSPKRQLTYAIWLNNQVQKLHLDKEISLSGTAKMIYTLTRIIVNQLWRYYNKGIKMMSIPFDYIPSSGSQLADLIKESEKSLIDVIENCQAGSTYSNSYKKMLETKSKEQEKILLKDINDSYVYRSILLQYLIKEGDVKQIKISFEELFTKDFSEESKIVNNDKNIQSGCECIIS